MKSQKFSVSLAMIFLLIPVLLFPLYVMIIGSFKNNMALVMVPPDLNPFSLTTATFKYVLSKFNLAGWFANSFLISAGITALTLFICTTAGYSFAKKDFKGKNLLFAVIIATMILPKQILLVPNYIVALNLSLTDKLIGVVLTSVAPPFGIFLCRQFMSTIPDELLEAAVIDGCSQPSIYVKIMMPLSKPVIGALAIFTFIASWNDFLWQFIMISSKSKWTMPIAVASFVGMKMSDIGYQLTAASISAVPMIVIFIAFQKFFIKGITMGAVKG